MKLKKNDQQLNIFENIRKGTVLLAISFFQASIYLEMAVISQFSPSFALSCRTESIALSSMIGLKDAFEEGYKALCYLG